MKETNHPVVLAAVQTEKYSKRRGLGVSSTWEISMPNSNTFTGDTNVI